MKKYFLYNGLIPATWLIVFLAGLPQISETVYTPSLPEIARALSVDASRVEYTLTIYLFGFAVGTLFWGKISDVFGRKPNILLGLLIYIIGCIGCYFSESITSLMVSRFIQAFGGSVGSVLAQALCRDAFEGPALGKIYSTVGTALALFPAIGPVVGGLIAENFGWSSIFIFLIIFGLILFLQVFKYMPETHHKEKRQRISTFTVMFKMLSDIKVLGFALIVAACNGIAFSYYGEGSFYLIEMLGLSPSAYGATFVAIAMATMIGGMISRKLHDFYDSKKILGIGLITILAATTFFMCTIFLSRYIALSNASLIGITIVSMMGTMAGICIATSNALSLSLTNYKYAIGAASSLFGFFYYAIISLFTLGMAMLRNDTLFPMPVYFFAIALFMGIVFLSIIDKKNALE